MVTLILGQTLVFWSGILAGASFVLLMLTCWANLGCMAGFFGHERRKRLASLHKHFVWASIVTMALHAVLALLASVFHVWL